MRTTAELREGFLAFFEEKGHVRQPSASLIPRADDHTTLFISAGMQPLMPYFLKREEPPAPLVVNTQKVFRTGDIDEVGLNARTLTFFEMMGSWSFGRYFKEEAIAYATEFVQERLKFDWSRIWATVHAGDPELGLGPDEEAVALWEKIGLPAERITPLPSSENFWSVGGPGPCGPTPSSSTTGARKRDAVVRTALPAASATASSSSGTSCSCPTSCTRTAR